MTEKYQGIVIDVTKHTDRNSVVTLYTATHGRVAFLSPVGSGRSAKLRQARLLPLSVIEGDGNFKPNAELQRLGAFSPLHVWGNMYFHPVKQVLALFLSEFLNKFLRASMPDTPLWNYIVESLALLDGMETGINDFHIVFLTTLLPFAGIQPDPGQWEEGSFFDLQTGMFTDRRPLHRDWIGGEEAAFAAKLCRIDFSNFKALRLNANSRMRTLGLLLQYYGIHFPGTSNLKSLQVVHDIFHS